MELRVLPGFLAGRRQAACPCAAAPVRGCLLVGHLVGHDARRTVPWCCWAPNGLARAVRPLPPQGQQSNNVRGQAGAFGSCGVGGSGIPRVDGAQSTPGWGLPPCPAFPSLPSCSPDPVDEAGGTFGDEPPCHPVLCLTRASFRLALTLAGPRARPQPLPRMGAGIAPFPPGVEGCQLQLLHISHRDSIGPRGLGSKTGGSGGLWYFLGRGAASEKGRLQGPSLPPPPWAPRSAALR